MATPKKATLYIVGNKKSTPPKTNETATKFIKALVTPRINKSSNIVRSPLKKKST